MLPEPDEERARDLVARAFELNELAEYPAAIEAAAQASKLDARNALAHTVRAWALENLGGQNLGGQNLSRQHLDEARAAYETALSLSPTARWPRTALADLLYRAGERQEAERLYQGVADDTCEGMNEARNLEFRGWSQYRLGRLDDAIETFNASLTHDSDRMSVLFDLALALLATGRTDEAGDVYETAMRVARSVDVRRRRAPLAVASEDLEEAAVSHPGIAGLSQTEAIRERLHRELEALGAIETPPSG